MRFGIMTMQRGALVPSGMSAEEAVAHLATLDHADLARRLYNHGFNPIEIGGDMPLLLPHTLDPPTIERLAALKAETGLAYTVHLPLWSVEPSTPLAPGKYVKISIRDNGPGIAPEIQPRIFEPFFGT